MSATLRLTPDVRSPGMPDRTGAATSRMQDLPGTTPMGLELGLGLGVFMGMATWLAMGLRMGVWMGMGMGVSDSRTGAAAKGTTGPPAVDPAPTLTATPTPTVPDPAALGMKDLPGAVALGLGLGVWMGMGTRLPDRTGAAALGRCGKRQASPNMHSPCWKSRQGGRVPAATAAAASAARIGMPKPPKILPPPASMAPWRRAAGV